MKKRHRRLLRQLSIIAAAITAICIMPSPDKSAFCAYAYDSSFDISGIAYESDPNGNYEVSSASNVWSDKIGSFTVSGNIKEGEEKGGVRSFVAESGNISLSYTFDTSVLLREETNWCLTDDNSNNIDGVILEENIKSGAIIVQTSFDRKRWATLPGVQVTNAFKGESAAARDFYTTQDIQLQNGCYYRVIVAYKMIKKLPSSQIIFWEYDNNYDYRKITEIYEFYAENQDKVISADDEPKLIFSDNKYTKKRMALDGGFAEEEAISKDDPHYGWDIGEFLVNGFSDKVYNSDGDPVFLKKVGDRVALWFKLEQDIWSINGNSGLTVSEDTNGYDLAFEIKQTNFKRGALLIRYTDAQGEVHKTIYTDFLAANAYPGADTKVQLFEEGDYEVALDYELKVDGTFPKYTNYRIWIRFSIRNSNRMIFPKDAFTGSDLPDNSITENGFKIDTAGSKYLKINVLHKSLTNKNGIRTENASSSVAAKNGDVFTKEGIYTLTIDNSYPGEATKKVIYVGKDPFLKALANSGLSINELNERITSGWTIDDNGSLVYTAAESSAPQTTPEAVAVAATSAVTTIEDVPAPVSTEEESKEDVAEVTSPSVTVDEESSQAEESSSGTDMTTVILITAIIILIIVVVAAIVIIPKKRNATDEPKDSTQKTKNSEEEKAKITKKKTKTDNKNS